MKNYILRIPIGLALLVGLSLGVAPHFVSAAAVSLTSITSTSTPVYVNTGFATTSRATTGDGVNYQLTLDATPWQAPKINIFAMGSTSFSGSGTNWYYATTTSSTWTEGAVSFQVSWGDTVGTATTTISQSSLTGPNVTYDVTGPTLNSVSWSDVDGSTNISGTDTLALTFSETLATSTLTTSNLNTNLSLSGSHTFGTTANGLAISWNTAGTVLTITLGSDMTVASGDTINPTSAVKDSVGIAATGSTRTITDNLAPLTPIFSPDGIVFHGSQTITITSTGASSIRFTSDGSTPTCSSPTYSSITVSSTASFKAVGCDTVGNISTVATSGVFSPASGGGYWSTMETTATTSDTTGTIASSSEQTISATSSPSVTETATPVASAPAPAGLSEGQIAALINVLASFKVDQAVIDNVRAILQHQPVSPPANTIPVFQRDLRKGSTGVDVQELQRYLNAHGFTVAVDGPGSAEHETTSFGSATQAALIKLQKAVGIVPAAGYFGSVTRAYVQAHP